MILPATEASMAVLTAASVAVAALAGARALGAPILPLTGALEQLSEVQQHLLDPRSPLPSLLTYIEYCPTKKKRAQPERRWSPDSAWDPDPVEEQIQVNRCRAFLLEILRRAMHDWVLYRTHRELGKRQIAEHAYTWLFDEAPGHVWWHKRQSKKGQLFTSFLSICDVLDLDPDHVRRRVRMLTPKQILTAGRPAERRRRTQEEPAMTEYTAGDVDLEDLEAEESDTSRPTYSFYERQFAVTTLGYA